MGVGGWGFTRMFIICKTSLGSYVPHSIHIPTLFIHTLRVIVILKQIHFFGNIMPIIIILDLFRDMILYHESLQVE